MSEKAGRTTGWSLAAPLAMAGAAVACGFALWAETAGAGGGAIPLGRAPAWYAAEGQAALNDGKTGKALAAARLEVAQDPGAYQAQQRLAYAAIADAGGPTREALRALEAAYTLAPYPPADQMIWRVDLAEAVWAGVPDGLAAKTLTQIEALGGMGMEWEPRVRWCRSAMTEAIADAACATVPGVEKAKDRPATARISAVP